MRAREGREREKPRGERETRQMEKRLAFEWRQTISTAQERKSAAVPSAEKYCFDTRQRALGIGAVEGNPICRERDTLSFLFFRFAINFCLIKLQPNMYIYFF